MWYPKKHTNKSFDSEGNAYTQLDIDRKRSEAYRDKYQSNPVFFCEGCGGRAQCSAHTIPQARLKKIGKTELIWHPDAFWPACFDSNDAIENPKSVERWSKLRNIKKCLHFMQEHDFELFMKFKTNYDEYFAKEIKLKERPNFDSMLLL